MLLGIGMLAGGILLAVWGGFKRRMATSALGLIGLGAGLLVMGLAPAGAMPAALVSMFVVGLSLPVVNGPVMAVIQATVEPSMQGRVMSLLMSVAAAASPLALAVAGPLADVLGTQAWFLAAGVFCLGMAAAVRFVSPVMNIDNGRDAANTAVERSTSV